MKRPLVSGVVAFVLGSASATAINVNGKSQNLRHDAQALPTIPKPADIGPDGYPQLPTVEALLHASKSTAQALSSQTGFLERRLAEVQQQKAARLAKQKDIFEGKLKDQERGNLALLAENNKVDAEIQKLQHDNGVITKHAKELQGSNALMREELAALEKRLRTAASFAGSSLKSTDDSHAQELVVLNPEVQSQELARRSVPPPPPPQTFVAEDPAELSMASEPGVEALASSRPNLAEFQKKTASSSLSSATATANSSSTVQADEDDYDYDDDDDADAPSFVALHLTQQQEPVSNDLEVHEATKTFAKTVAGDQDPRGLLASLSLGVEALEKEEKESEAHLKQAFFGDFQVGAKRHAALLEHQKALKLQRDSLASLQQKLRTAESRLSNTRTSLTTRLHDAGVYVQKLGHLALLPAAEVPHVLQSLPESVQPRPVTTAAPAEEGLESSSAWTASAVAPSTAAVA